MKGAKAAPPHVKKRITPETAPCSLLLKQLIPFELMVGYITDMKSPDSGSNTTATCAEPSIAPAKQRRMAPVKSASTHAHEKCLRTNAPRKRPPARNKKK